ncbi:MAG: molybdopterin-dependent oxidoreductase [Candidatus Cloacimonetes bacterium]|nr:molybdopterin-dependent oxidoreductase [Candidatus Cloacimonadota bacterium]
MNRFKVIILVAILLYMWSLALSIMIIDSSRQFTLEIEDLRQLELVDLETKRERGERIRTDNWQGVYLDQILQSLEVLEYDQIKIISYDNYQVRLTRQDLLDSKALIALRRNDEILDEDNIRLVVPGMRDMYWIDGIRTIETEGHHQSILPNYIFFAEDLLTRLEVIEDPEPFKRVQGIYFRDLITFVYPIQGEEFLLVGRDGVSHQLDFDTYLKNGVLIINDDDWHFRSPDMPAGMWIKSLAYVQFFDRAIIFRTQFNNLNEVAQLLEWSRIPELLWDDNQIAMPVDIDFSDPVWEGIGILRWRK